MTLSKLLDKEVDASQVSQQLPLLPGYAAEIAAKELNSTVIQVCVGTAIGFEKSKLRFVDMAYNCNV